MGVLRIVLLGLAAVVCVALGWHLSAIRGSSPASLAPTASIVPPAAAPSAVTGAAPGDATALAARARIDAVFAGAPDLARAVVAVKAQFPAIADRSLAAAADAYRRSGVLPSPDDLFAAVMHDIRLSAGVLAAKAGPEALGALFEDKARLLADLEQADPRICADYLFGGTSPEFSDFQAAHRALVADTALAMVAAMADGRTRQKDWGAPTGQDFKAIETGLAGKGLSPEEIHALLDGAALDPPPPDARLCDNARAYLDVLRAMPEDARDRVYGMTAELLARS